MAFRILYCGFSRLAFSWYALHSIHPKSNLCVFYMSANQIKIITNHSIQSIFKHTHVVPTLSPKYLYESTSWEMNSYRCHSYCQYAYFDVCVCVCVIYTNMYILLHLFRVKYSHVNSISDHPNLDHKLEIQMMNSKL